MDRMMTKSLILAAALICPTLPAFAQSGGWNSQSYFQNGPMPMTHYDGTGANSGWSGDSTTYFKDGPMPQTDSTFTGPNGQSENCVTTTYRNLNNMTSTNCN